MQLVNKYDRSEDSSEERSSKNKSGLRILVIDDDPILLTLLKQQLENNGHAVITANSGKEGLRIALQTNPQLVITDLTMPDMDGLTLCSALRDVQLGQLIYIIMLTVHNDEEHLLKAFSAGADDYLCKPFSERELIARIGAGDRVIKLQREIEIERQHNHLYLDTVEVVIIGLDVTGCITLVNRKGCELLGYQERELLDENWFDLFIPDRKIEESRNNFYKVIKNKIDTEQYSTESTVKCINDEKLVSWHCSYFYDVDGHIGGLLCAGQDVTEKVRSEKENSLLQKQIQQSQKMESIGQLTGGMAHDFNNILASILGYTNLAQERFSKDNDKLAEYLNEVYQAGERARDLVSQMLVFSRGGCSESQALSLSLVVQRGIKMLQSTIPSSIELNTLFEKDLPKVMMDPVQLHQIIMNLCINARDAMQGSGILNVKLQLVKNKKIICSSCQGNIAGDYVELQVSDTGNGIEPENRERIFDPFFSTKEIGKGTGMGLSMVHGIVHNHGGHIELQSKLNQGTTFSLLFPVTRTDTDDIEKNLNINATRHVLVVEDEEAVARFLKEIIELRHYKVTVMTDSEKALALFAKNPHDIDVIITDYMMPNLTGISLAKAVLEIRADMPVLLCTGQHNELDESSLQKVGIKHLIAKPVNVNSMLDIIENILGK